MIKVAARKVSAKSRQISPTHALVVLGLVSTIAIFGVIAQPLNRDPRVTYGFIWLMGILGMGYCMRRLVKQTAEAERAAAALRSSQVRYRRLFDDAPVAYHEIDRDGTVTAVNATECELLGYEAEELLGHPVWKAIPVEMQAQSRENVRRKITGEQALKPYCRVYARRDGKRFVVEVHEKLTYTPEGEVAGIRSALLDVTERERALRELALRTEELARSNAELEQFAYVASHDLQEPLRKIMAFGDRLRTKFADVLGETGCDYLERMRNAAGRMQVLINDLLMLSRVKRKGQPFTLVDLGKVMRDVQSDLEVRIEQLQARVEIEELPTITADLLQMSQLLQNLVGNALKFRKPEGKPVVKIRGEMLPRQADTPPDQTARTLCRLTIEDNGIGFEEKYADRIFQVFQRLHGRNEFEGTGIGLAICRHIVERHGGTITAKSAPGEGSRFIVTLPVEQETGEGWA